MRLCENCGHHMTLAELLVDRDNPSREYCIYCARFESQNDRWPFTLFEALSEFEKDSVERR